MAKRRANKAVPQSFVPSDDAFFDLIESGKLDIKLPKGRNFESMAIVGDKRRGKSKLVSILIRRYRKKFPNRPILILDYSNAFGEDDFNGLKIPGYDPWTIEELLNGKRIMVQGKAKRARWVIDPSKGPVGAIRIVKYGTEEDFRIILEYIANVFEGGLVVMDEAAVFFKEKATMEQRGLLIQHTNKKNELWCIFHRLKDVPIQLRHHFWNYILFATGDEFTSAKEMEKANFPDPTRFYERYRTAKDFPVLNDDGTRNLISLFETFAKDPSNPAETYRHKLLEAFKKLVDKGKEMRDKGITMKVEPQDKVIRIIDKK